MIRFLILLFFLSATSCAQPKGGGKLLLGAEQFDTYLSMLKGKRVALLVNNTSVMGQGKANIVDALVARRVNIKKIFSPEHGFRGNAADGDEVNDEVDSKTGLPVVSLYGNNKKPQPEQLADVDIVIFDIQDVGTRFYTYSSSLTLLMEACAENNKKVIVFDRPNPNGFVDGPILQMENQSFVGMHPIPIAHGLTIGELARMVNGQGWLAGGKKCDLEVIRMSNYTHDDNITLPVKPSPNLPTDHAVKMYPYICLFEGTAISLGRGTTHPFEVLGHPDLKGQPFQFTPVPIAGMSTKPPLEGKLCYGIDLRNEKIERRINLKYLIDMYRLFPDKEKFFTPYIDKLSGTKEFKEQIKKGMTEEQIRETWQKDLTAYKEMRKQYLLYP